MNELFCIGIPTVVRHDLLNEALSKYVTDFPNTLIIICDNGINQPIFQHTNILIFRQTENLGVARSWNLLCKEIFQRKIQNAIISNDDIYWGQNEQGVTDFLINNNEEDFIVSPGTWCNFILRQSIFSEIGPFDESFIGAYYEDNDYHWRMKLANKTYLPSPFMSPKVFRNSKSIEALPVLNKNFGNNKAYYMQKWGGLPGEEIFTVPENDPSKPFYKLQ